MTRIIHQHVVEDHGVIVKGHNQKVVLVAISPDNEVTIWVEHALPLDGLDPRVQYLTMGTGWGMEDDESFHAGSCITPGGRVAHVYGKALDRA